MAAPGNLRRQAAPLPFFFFVSLSSYCLDVDASWTTMLRPDPIEGGGVGWKEQSHGPALEFLPPHFELSEKFQPCSSHSY